MDSLKVDWAVTVPPSIEPISPSDMTPYLRVDFTDDNPIVSALISAYREDAEIKMGRSFAPQTLQAMWTLPQVNAGSLTGPRLLYEQDFYQYNESLGSNPFSPAPFILPMPQPPLVAVSLFEYRLTAFANWQTWPALVGSTPNYVVDTLPIPGVVYLQYPPPAYQYRLTYTAGYSMLPAGMKLALMQYIAWKYDNREGEEMPAEILNALIGRKIWVL